MFWRIDTQAAGEVFDAQGHVLKAQLGNGVVTDHRYDAISGKAFNLRAGYGGTNSNVYDQRYTYDKADNLASRTEGLSGVVENFAYDVLDRLQQYQVQSASDAGAGRTVSLQYNLAGNIDNKSDVGPYTYNAGAKPHAVRSAGGTNYDYDANGNLTGSTGAQSRTQTWTDFNQPNVLSYQGKSVAFSYDASYKRVKEVTTDGATARTLFLIHPDNAGGLGFEREETRVNGSLVRNESRHYLSVGGAVVAVVKTLNSGDPVSGPLNAAVSSDPTLTQYWHKDALGSIVAVTNAAASGTVAIERMAFDAWGRRLRATGLVDPAVNPAHGDRGYTGHEHLDELALVHMNGRVYDPVLARFLSPDPMLQSPGDLQNYNRYSYVLNNPLRYTDPSGYSFLGIDIFIWKVIGVVAGAAMIADGNKYWKMVGTVAFAWGLGGSNGLVEEGLGIPAQLTATAGNPINSMVAGFATGLAASGGDFESAFIGAWTAGAFTAVGGANLGLTGKVIGHALIGCASQAVSGGKCGPGAMAAAFGKLATEGMGLEHNIVAITLVGGTASVIGGGKFANGAMTAAMGYLFNQLAGPPGSSSDAKVKAVLARGDAAEMRGLMETMEAAGELHPAGRVAFERAIARAELTGARLSQEASRHGFDKAVKDPPFNPHGQKVFTDGKNFLTRDIDSHSGGVWKMFDRTGNRIGTFDQNMGRIAK